MVSLGRAPSLQLLASPAPSPPPRLGFLLGLALFPPVLAGASLPALVFGSSFQGLRDWTAGPRIAWCRGAYVSGGGSSPVSVGWPGVRRAFLQSVSQEALVSKTCRPRRGTRSVSTCSSSGANLF